MVTVADREEEILKRVEEEKELQQIEKSLEKEEPKYDIEARKRVGAIYIKCLDDWLTFEEINKILDGELPLVYYHGTNVNIDTIIACGGLKPQRKREYTEKIKEHLKRRRELFDEVRRSGGWEIRTKQLEEERRAILNTFNEMKDGYDNSIKLFKSDIVIRHEISEREQIYFEKKKEIEKQFYSKKIEVLKQLDCEKYGKLLEEFLYFAIGDNIYLSVPFYGSTNPKGDSIHKSLSGDQIIGSYQEIKIYFTFSLNDYSENLTSLKMFDVEEETGYKWKKSSRQEENQLAEKNKGKFLDAFKKRGYELNVPDEVILHYFSLLLQLANILAEEEKVEAIVYVNIIGKDLLLKSNKVHEEFEKTGLGQFGLRDPWFTFFGAEEPFVAKESFARVSGIYGGNFTVEVKPSFNTHIQWKEVIPGGLRMSLPGWIPAAEKGGVSYDLITLDKVDFHYILRIYTYQSNIDEIKAKLKAAGLSHIDVQLIDKQPEIHKKMLEELQRIADEYTEKIRKRAEKEEKKEIEEREMALKDAVQANLYEKKMKQLKMLDDVIDKLNTERDEDMKKRQRWMMMLSKKRLEEANEDSARGTGGQ